MATLGFGSIIYRIILGTRLFGEADGISDVPALQLGRGISISGKPCLKIENYYAAWFFVAVLFFLIQNLVRSRTGRALKALHSSEEAAEASGIDTARYKILTFILSAVLAALGGALLTHYNGGIGPSEAHVMKSVRYVAIVACGGRNSLWGPFLIGLILNFLSLRGTFGFYDDAVFAALLILMMLFAPEGLLKLRLPALRKKR